MQQYRKRQLSLNSSAGKKVDVVAEVDEEVSAESIDLDLSERKQLKEKKVRRKGEAAEPRRHSKTQVIGGKKTV